MAILNQDENTYTKMNNQARTWKSYIKLFL